jgi:type II secretory pathway component GspD/PulD (secretin)
MTVGWGMAGLMTGLLLLTAAPPPARGQAPAEAPASPPAAADAQRPPGPARPASVLGLAKRISLDLRQMDILAVLKFLAEQGDFNIVPGKNVGGRVTLAVKDITIQDALDVIALTNELAYVVQSRVIHVMTEADYQRLFGAAFGDQREVRTVHLQYADATTVATVLGNVKSAVGRVVADPGTRTIILIDVPEKMGQMVTAAEGMDRAAQLQTQAFELRYGKAADIKPEVEKALTPKVGAVRMDKRTNTLVVTDLGPQMQEIQRVINAFDRKTREVVIQAKIMEVRLDDRLAIGVNWESVFRALVDVEIRTVFPVTPPLTSSGSLTFGTFGQERFRDVVELLQTVGRTNILSTPQIAVVENEEAKILVGTREAYVTSAVTQTTTAATTAEQVTFVDVGLQLRVTASINDDGFVSMKIKPEVSSVTRELTTAAGNVIPIIDTSSAETTVMVKDGTTLVIAGLMKEDKIATERKFPILADIPILGVLFRSRDDRVAKTELIFFLTPTIISGGESISVRSPELQRPEEPKEE